MNEDTPPEATQPAMQRAEPAGLDSRAVGWAWAQPIANNPGARIVLMCLAGRVNETWQCIASQEEVAMDAMMSARSVRRHLEQLEADGFIARRRRFDDKGHRLPDLCRVNPGASLPANLSGRDESNRPDYPVANLDTGSEQGESLEDKLASGQIDLWAGWPAGMATETDIRRSGPVANLPTGQIGRAISTSPTEKYEETNSSSTPKRSKAKPSAATPPRNDVERLCARLVDWMKRNEVRKIPEISETWRREARLLLDKDRVSLDEAMQVLDWCQRDTFWSQNIHSMPTFRDKYGQLEMKSRGVRDGAPVRQLRPTGTNGHVPYQNPVDQSVYHEDF